MSADTSTSSSTPAAPERVFVEIPKAGPGQGYKAPPNRRQPLVDLLTRVITVLMCLSLPLVVLTILVMIFWLAPVSRTMLWLWIPLGLFIEAIGIFVAVGIGREMLGTAGSGRYTR